MTALAQYQRLEAQGTWRAGPGTQRREVIVSFGDATLVISDPRSEVPVSHWSLPAVTRLNPGSLPAIYAPDATGANGGDEQLEVADPLMIDAIERVHQAIEGARPHPGRLRGRGMVLIAILMAGLGAWWLPGALVDHAARLSPPAQRTAIGTQVLADMARTTGPACNRPAGAAVLARLGPRLLGPGAQVAILPQGLPGARALPGGVTVLGRDALAPGTQTMTAALGHLLAVRTAAEADDPLRDALNYAGTGAVLSLLTRGVLPPDALHGIGETILREAEPRPEDDPLLARFAQAGLSSEPYARALDPSGESTLALIEADPFRTRLPDAQILSDEEWTSLIAICDP